MALLTPRVNQAESDFVTEADWIPGFWNFLLGLDQNDLIAELIQNDLDQEATRTVIAFEKDHLVCEGNGKPVDTEGWQRLRKISGRRKQRASKAWKNWCKEPRLKMGIYNRRRDSVAVCWAGNYPNSLRPGIEQSTISRRIGRAETRRSSPTNGCRVLVRYRNRRLEPREGEAIVLAAIGADDIDALFKSACISTPGQFAGIVSPEVAPTYEIVLRHWQLGEARFVFSCTRPRKIANHIETYRRRCEVSGTAVSLPDGIEEEAARRLLPLKGRLRERVPDFFKRKHQFFVEVSWPVDKRGKPQTGTGRFRYPIGYPESSTYSRTGHGVYFNAPIVSDTERHGPARNDPSNGELRRACEALLVNVMDVPSSPKWKADALNPLVPSPSSQNEDEAVRPLLAALAKRGAVPTIQWRDAVKRSSKGRRLKGPIRLQRRERPGGKHYRFVAPVATWAPTSIHTSLSVVCPSNGSNSSRREPIQKSYVF